MREFLIFELVPMELFDSSNHDPYDSLGYDGHILRIRADIPSGALFVKFLVVGNLTDNSFWCEAHQGHEFYAIAVE